MSRIEPSEAWARRDEVFFLDVREPAEWVAGHIAEATHVPMNQLTGARGSLPGDRTIVCVCRSGNRSAAVTTALQRAGFDAVNMVGGMKAWAADDLPWVSETDDPPRVA